MTFIKNTSKLYKDKTIRIMIMVGVIIFIVMAISKEFIKVNFTESEPKGIYLLSKTKNYNKNDLVTINNNINPTIRLAKERKYTSFPRLLKTVMGVPGDRISIVDNIISVNNVIIGKIHTVDSQNRPLPSMVKEGIIPPEYYFLASKRHENSFDSRYFGLIPKECIQKKAVPLWVSL